MHVGKQAKGLFLRTAVAEIGRNIVATVEHDFGAAGKEAKHLVIIARAQSVAIVCRQSDVTIGRHAVQMLQRGDARRAIRTPHAREVLDHGLAPHRTREGVAFCWLLIGKELRLGSPSTLTIVTMNSSTRGRAAGGTSTVNVAASFVGQRLFEF